MATNQLEPLETPSAVDALIVEYFDALDRGHPPTRADWLGRHPEHADELARFLDDLERLSPPARTAQTDETQMLPGGIPSQQTTRDSETIVWEAVSGSGSAAQRAADLPFHGAFGDYELLDLVARGGMGVVFKARHRRLDRVVALKMILAGQLADEQHVQRFQAEAKAAAHLNHPGIVPVYEVGEQHGLHYFTMAFVEGKSLAERLRDGPLPPKEAARLVRDLAAAIAYAHEHGIVHRDLKPGNVLIDSHGQPKLTDFGLAKQTHQASDMTGAGQVLGTPSYMSPEQARGGAATAGPASDVYGLGALLFALVTGRPPFQGSTPVDTIQHVLVEETPRPRTLNPGVPRDLETICLKCLEKAPPKRYASATALKDDLDRFLDDQPILARPVGVIERAYRWYRRRPVFGTMAGALAVLLVAVPVLLAGMLLEAEGRARAEAAGHAQEKVARAKIEAAEQERTKQLFAAYVNEAAARRTSPRVGRGFNALARILDARDLADELKLPAADYTRLRSEAISALSLVDLRSTKTGPGWHLAVEPYSFQFLGGKDCYLSWDKPDGVLVRRRPDGRVVQRFPVENADSGRNRVWLSADSRFVSSLVNNKLVIWQVDAAKPKEIARHDQVSWAHFAPDRAEIIAYKTTREIVVQPLDGQRERTIRIDEFAKQDWPAYWQWQMRPGPRRQLAVAGLRRVHLVDLDARKLVGDFAVPGQVQDIAWTPAGDTVAVAISPLDDHANLVVLYQPATKSQHVLKSSVGGPERLCFDGKGELLMAYNEWTNFFTLARVSQGSVSMRFHQTEISSVGLHKNPACWHGTVDVPHCVVPVEYTPQYNHSSIHPAGRLMATPTTRGIALTDLATGKRVAFLAGPEGLYCCFDAEGNLYAQQAGPDRRLHPHRWTVSAKGNRYEIGAPERIAFPCGAGLAVTPDGRFLAGGGYNGAAVLDRKTGKRFDLGPQHDVRFVACHPKEPWIASFGFSSDGFRISDATNGTLLHQAGKGGLGNGRFTPDGKHLIAFGYDQPGLTLWSMPTCNFVRDLGPLGAFGVSPDSRYIAVAELGGKVRLTRIADGELIARFDAPGEEYIADATFSPDGRYLVGLNVDRNRHHIWDLWKLRHRLSEMKLDWEKDPPPAAPAVEAPIEVRIAK